MKIKNWLWVLALAMGSSGLFFSCSSSSDDHPVPVIYDINGGAAGSGTSSSLFIIDGLGFGTPTSGTTGYSVEFRDATTDAIVATAAVNLSVSGNWTDVFIKATVPTQLLPGTTYKVTVTTPGGTSNALNFLVLANVSFSPSTILWSPASSLPVAQQGFPAVAGSVGTSLCIYAIGGNTAVSGTVDAEKMNVDTVYLNHVNSTDGALVDANWASLAPLPGKRGFASAVFANSYNSLINGSAIYVLGGLDDTGAATSTVFQTLLNADGTIPAVGSAGSWSATTALPQALYAAGSAIFHGRIYVAGGTGSTGAPVTKVYSAKINANGTLGSWSEQAALPLALTFHQLVEVTGTLYVLGGNNAATDPLSAAQNASVQDSVLFNPIDLETGALEASWTTNANKLTKAREKFSAVGAGAYVLVSGGLYAGSPGSSEESYASVNIDGSLSSFNGATGVHTISNYGGYDFFNHSHCYVVDSTGHPHVIILGGADVGTGILHAEVWYQH